MVTGSHKLKSLPLRRLLTGPTPSQDAVFYHNIWFRHHNNRRYEELLPRLDRLHPYLITLSGTRLVRGIQLRGLRSTARLWKPLVHRLASRRYRWMFSTDIDQVPFFTGRTVVDIDDPKFGPREVEILNAPQVAAFVVTAREAGERYEELGVRKPWHVIPQGVDLSAVSAAQIADARRRYRTEEEVVIGFVVSHLLTRGDRGGEDPLYNADHLFELWGSIRKLMPSASLWLVGAPSRRLLARYGNMPGVRFFGRVPGNVALALMANFDVALYPRTLDQGVRTVKVAEYMCMGIPTVSYRYSVTRDIEERGAGVLVESPGEFVDAVRKVVEDQELHRRLSGAAMSARRDLDWDLLAEQYQTGILDQYLR